MAHIACAYEGDERDVFAEAEAVGVCLNEYDAVRAMVCRAVGIPAHRIECERDSMSPGPVSKTEMTPTSVSGIRLA